LDDRDTPQKLRETSSRSACFFPQSLHAEAASGSGQMVLSITFVPSLLSEENEDEPHRTQRQNRISRSIYRDKHNWLVR
jgi:hypothetical protein